MTTDLALTGEQSEAASAALAHVLGSGDLSQLSNAERVGYYLRLCRSLGLNELSRPFDWIYFKGAEGEPERLVLYPNQSCTAQLRRQHHMRVEITRRETVGELFVVEATAYTPDGRVDVASKYVSLVNKYGPLKGRIRGNAMMAAETGAKRRVTLSMVGLSTPPGAEDAVSWRAATVDGTGAVLRDPTPEQKALAADPGMARVIGEPVFEDAEVGDGAGAPSQAATPAELAPPPRPAGPPATLKNGEKDIKRWEGAWFAAVAGMSLDTDDARAAYIARWTADIWPPNKQTSSLPIFLARATPAEVGDFLAYTRAIMAAEKEELLAQSHEDMPDPPAEADDGDVLGPDERPF